MPGMNIEAMLSRCRTMKKQVDIYIICVVYELQINNLMQMSMATIVFATISYVITAAKLNDGDEL